MRIQITGGLGRGGLHFTERLMSNYDAATLNNFSNIIKGLAEMIISLFDTDLEVVLYKCEESDIRNSYADISRVRKIGYGSEVNWKRD